MLVTSGYNSSPMGQVVSLPNVPGPQIRVGVPLGTPKTPLETPNFGGVFGGSREGPPGGLSRGGGKKCPEWESY